MVYVSATLDQRTANFDVVCADTMECIVLVFRKDEVGICTVCNEIVYH